MPLSVTFYWTTVFGIGFSNLKALSFYNAVVCEIYEKYTTRYIIGYTLNIYILFVK